MKVATSDSWIATEWGRLFARSWKPSDMPTDRRETILLFHDSLGCVELWHNFPAELALATGRPVVAYDRLGFGQSDACDGPLAPTSIRDEAVKVVPRLLEQLGLTKGILFGHSVGGSMAVSVASHLPGRCEALITESAPSFVEDRTLVGVRAGEADFERPDRFERLVRYHGSKACWVLDAWVKTWLKPSFRGWCLDDDLKGVSCPTLVIHGDRDDYASREQPERIERLAMGQARVVILEGCGRVPHREVPARVLKEVAQFCRCTMLFTWPTRLLILVE
jgi:pimeloyl-ACP methyl ester carboxylesterase